MQLQNEQLSVILKGFLNHVLQLDFSFHILTRLYLPSHDKRSKALNIAPFFFLPVRAALVTYVVLELNKMFRDKGKERSFINLLSETKTNLDNLSIDREILGEVQIDTYLRKIKQQEPTIKNLSIQRNRFIAHNDPRYFGNQAKIIAEAPVDLNQMRELVNLSKEIIRTYYMAFFDSDFQFQPTGEDDQDVDHLMELILRYQRWLEDEELIDLIEKKSLWRIN